MTNRRWRIAAIVLALALVTALWMNWMMRPGFFNGMIGTGMRDATVVHVCPDGTLVTQINEHFFVVRPDASRGWPAVGADVCSR